MGSKRGPRVDKEMTKRVPRGNYDGTKKNLRGNQERTNIDPIYNKYKRSGNQNKLGRESS